MIFEIKQILEREKGNSNCIYAYRDGAYWKVYEMSAYSLNKVMKMYKPIDFQVKELYSGILYISMSLEELNKTCKKLDLVENKDDFMQYSTPWISKEEYDLWKYNCRLELNSSVHKQVLALDLSADIELKSNQTNDALPVMDLNDIIKEIKTFPMELKTPMECMNWISSLKKMISNY